MHQTGKLCTYKMYNFLEIITSHVVIEKKQRKHTYKDNFSVAVHMCRLFYHGKATPPDLEAIIAKNLIPISLIGIENNT